MKIYLNPEFKDFLNKNAQGPSNVFETESDYISVDVLSEGPIEGLVNSDGNSLNYIDTGNDSFPILGKGIYYNNIPLVDKKTNFYNYSQASFSTFFGNQFKNSVLYSYALYEYRTKVYDLSYAAIKTYSIKTASNKESPGIDTVPFDDKTTDPDLKNYIKYKNYASVVSHSVQNKYASNFEFNVSIDNLFNINDSNGSTLPGYANFIVNATNLANQRDFYLYVKCSLVAKGGALILPFIIDLDIGDRINNKFPEIILSVYSLRGSVSGSTTENRSFSLNSVVENIIYPFSFPYSALVYNAVSSKHFNNIPVRSYDCKLLKIKVPDNYDSEAREYLGDWSGNFNKTLKWTNNPAWIFYDLATNSRYGMARGQIQETDLNKWQFLTLSKYCDELVKTNSSTQYAPNIFFYDNDLKYGQENFNCITITTSYSLAQLGAVFPVGSIIYLYDIKNKSQEFINKNYKKLICSVSLSGSVATIKLCNDFGPRQILEQDLNGNLFKVLSKYLKDNPKENVEDKIKIFILKYFLGTTNLSLTYRSEDESVSKNHMSKKIFDSDLNVKNGYCVAKHSESADYLEPRFSCNVLINNEVEGLKALTDLSSIFRGMFYFKDGLLCLSSDVKQNAVYIFTNSNVKDGLFTYASSDLNTSFSVAKVPYLDKYDNFKDKIVYVEDASLIRKFGIVEKEILSFGITSRSEAQRIGKWYLATGKLESEIVGFSTGLEGSLLQIGNVIRISDSLKNSAVVYGKITDLNFKDNYIYIDREVPADCLGKLIKIFSLINENLIELAFSVYEVDNTNLKLKILPSPYMSWNIVKNIVVSDNGYKLTPTTSSDATAWDKKTYTNKSYIDSCQISYISPNAAYDQNVVGLSRVKNISIGNEDIDYGFIIVGGSLQVRMGTNNYSVYTGYSSVSSSDVLKIIYDGQYIRFLKNDVSIYDPQPRSKGQPLYGVVALYNKTNSIISDLKFSPYPAINYGRYSDLRSGTNFTINLDENDSRSDLFKVISINEVSSNEYAISAMKYEEEKFNIIEKNTYVDKAQTKPKQITFSTQETINEIFNDTEISLAIKFSNLNYVQSASFDFDYSFDIEEEILKEDYFNSKYEALNINFPFLFSILDVRGATNVFGIMCVINRNGKTLRFNVLKANQAKIDIFLGENRSGNAIYKTILDFYAFDINYKIINV